MDRDVRLVTDRQPYENAAEGRVVVEDFTDTFHFPIVSCRLNSSTRQAGLRSGDIEPGVTYSTDCDRPELFELNIDFGSFEGGFLDGFHHNETGRKRALLVTFDKPTQAIGFDTNVLMGRSFDIRIYRTPAKPNGAGAGAGIPRVSDFRDISVDAPFEESQFFGFVSDAFDISRVRIIGEGDETFGFALDNFTFDVATIDNGGGPRRAVGARASSQAAMAVHLTRFTGRTATAPSRAQPPATAYSTP